MMHSMDAHTYTVTCHWDQKAHAWYVAESDVPGLATEAATVEEMERQLLTLIPELLELNEPGFVAPAPFELVARKYPTLSKSA